MVCLQYILAVLASHCPLYGQAVSGISKSLMDKVFNNCFSERNNIWPDNLHSFVHCPNGAWNVPSFIKAWYGLPVVPDDTPFALHDLPLDVSGIFEHVRSL